MECSESMSGKCDPPASARGAWTTRGLRDWNHATDMLKQHNSSEWDRDTIVVSKALFDRVKQDREPDLDHFSDSLWVVDGQPTEHFMTVIHVNYTDAESIPKALTSYIEEKGFEYRKLVGQAYDGEATSAGVNTLVQKRIRTHAGHALYIHSIFHRLQLASMEAA
ncbi:Zinc finger protein [Oopsacas minuta]|uniref:Zinc finger protein n=1 Tax=Oopsacas minuta TaxID=111878 RepID=A0AAV7JHT0_9METZ|nr:Zinc finger protein [Oopsacas minuta]